MDGGEFTTAMINDNPLWVPDVNTEQGHADIFKRMQESVDDAIQAARVPPNSRKMFRDWVLSSDTGPTTVDFPAGFFTAPPVVIIYFRDLLGSVLYGGSYVRMQTPTTSGVTFNTYDGLGSRSNGFCSIMAVEPGSV